MLPYLVPLSFSCDFYCLGIYCVIAQEQLSIQGPEIWSRLLLLWTSVIAVFTFFNRDLELIILQKITAVLTSPLMHTGAKRKAGNDFRDEGLYKQVFK